MNAEGLLRHYDRIADAPDAIARLRHFILDLAVRGKLVPQILDDQPAAALLKHIAATRAAMVKGGTTRERLELPAVGHHEVPFALPESWRWVRFSHISGFGAGRTPSRNDTTYWDAKDYAWVSISDMVDGEVLLATKEAVSEKACRQVFGSPPEVPGTMIMSFKLTIGKIARLGVPAYHNEAIIAIKPYLAELDPYLFKVLPKFALMGDTKGAIKGSTLNRESISNILIPLPPQEEQHRIVAKVDELMALCDQLEAARAKREAARDRLTAATLARLNAPDPETFADDAGFALYALPELTARTDQIKQLRQTILNLAVQGKLVVQDPADEPASEQLKRIDEKRQSLRHRASGQQRETLGLRNDLPRGWQRTTLGSLAVDMRYGTSKKCSYEQVGTPVLRIPNVSSGQVRLEDMKFGPLTETEQAELSLLRGDLLIIRSNGSLEIVGRAAVVGPAAEGMSFAGYLVRVRMSVDNVLPEFVWLTMNTDGIRSQIEKPIRSAVGLKNVNSSEISALSFYLPPLAEQHRIVAKVDGLLAMCAQLEASLTTGDFKRSQFLEALLQKTLQPANLLPAYAQAETL